MLQEEYDGADGLKGESFSIYDMPRKVWHQSWVTNRGQVLVLEGTMRTGVIALTGMDHTADGKARQVRGTWKPGNEGVRETAVRSLDDGKTWEPWFDLLFRPVAVTEDRARAPSADAEKIVAALDTEYQAAVLKNDALEIGRILADDFVLVTGSGKTYTKAALLDEVRSGRILYERQDDSARTVRVWRGMAVVTAKLSEKGTDNGKPFEYALWFSDTYVRTPTGWRYEFGQASLPLPKTLE